MPLTPVDYDPFEETKQPAQPSETQGLKLVPVDYDPFASEQKEGVLEKAAFTAMKPWATFPEKEQRDFVKGLAKRFYAGALETATSINRLLGFSPESRLVKPAERKIQKIRQETQPKSKLEKVGYKFMETLGSLGTTLPLDVMTGGATKLSLGSRVIPRVAEILSRIPDFAVGMGIRGAIAGAKEGETIPERTISALKKGAENLAWGVIYGRLGGRYQIPKFGALGAAEATYQASKEGRLPTKEEIEEGVAHGMALGTLFSMLPWLAKKTQVGIERTILNKAQRNIEKAYREGRFEDIEKEFDALSTNEKLRPEVRQAVKEIKETTLPPKEKSPAKEVERPEAEVVEPERAREAIITAVKRDLARGRDEAGNSFGIDELFALKEHPEIQRLGLDDEINKLIIEEQAKPPPERVNVAELLPKRPVVEPEKKPYKEERPVVLGEEEKPPAKEIVAPEGVPAEIARIQAKPAFLRTAEEKLTLERYEKGKKKPKIETAPEERKREIIVPEGEVKKEKAREERKVTEEKPPAKEVKEKPKPEKKAKPYEGVEPGSAEWMKIWKEHPELQKEMAEIRQKQIVEEGKKEKALPEVKAKKEPWEMTKEEFVNKQDSYIKKITPHIEQVRNNNKTIEINAKEINPQFPDVKIIIYSNRQSKTPTFYDKTGNKIYLNLDTKPDILTKVLKIDNDKINAIYSLLHEFAHIKGIPEDWAVNLLRYKGKYQKLHQKRAIEASKLGDAWLRNYLDKHKEQIEQNLKQNKPVPEEVLKEYPDLAKKYKKEPPKEKPSVVPLTKTLYENSYPIELSKASEEFPEHRLGVDYVVKLVDKNTGKVTWASLSEKRARELFPRSFEEKGKEVAKAETEWQPVKNYGKEITEGTHVKWRYRGKEGEGIATGKIGKRKTGFVYHRVKTPEGKTKYMPWTSRAEYWIKAEKEVKLVKEAKAEVKEKEPIITQPKENLYEVRHPEKKTWYQIKEDPETEQWRVVRFEPYETTYEGKKVTINKGIETKFFNSLEEAKKFAQKEIVEKKPEPEKTIKVHEHGEEYIVRDKDYEETASKTRKEILNELQGLEWFIPKPPKFIPVSEKAEPAKEGGGIKTIAEGIRKDLIKTGRVDLRSKEIKHPADLAVVAQVYRDPRFETLRIFYMKGNKIVAHEGITNRMPNFVASELTPKFIWEIKNRMKRLGADGYYLVHNHPSGNPSPSLDDINFTLACADKIPGLKHHIIINSGKYGAIREDGVAYVLPLPGIPKDWVDPLLSPTKPHGLLGFKIKTEKDLALISRSFKDDSKVVTLIYCSGNKIRLIQEVPARLFTNVEQITNYIRGRVREFGTNHVFAVFSGKYEETKDLYNTSTELIRKNILTDAAFSGTTIRQATNIHAEANEIWGLRQIPEYRLGEPIEEYSKRIAWAKEYLERIKAKEGLKKEVKKEPVITKDIAKKTGEVDKIFTPEEPAAMVRISARRLMAERAREIDAIVEATKISHEWWDRQPVDKQILYIDKMMKGDTDFSEFGKDSKVVKDMAQQHRALLDKAYEIDKSVNERLDYLENYWPGIWKNREKAEAWIQKKLNTTPGYYKHKFYKLMSDGIKAGLEPITTNPQEMVLWRYFSALHHKMRKDFLNEMKAYELLKFKRGFKKPPKGWAVPKDPSLQVFFRGKEGMVRTGEWIMPKEAANIVDKWLSPSLWSRPDNWGKVFKAFMAVKNPFVAVKLGLSGFHFLNVTLSDLTYNVMRLTNSTLKGDIDVALDRFADILTGPVSSLKLGHKAVELWLGKRSIQTDLDKEIVNYLIRAGARYKLSKAYKIGLEDNWKKAIRDFRKKNIIGGTIKLIPAIAEKIQAPLMEWYVPRLKIGAFLKQAKDFTSAHPEIKGAKLDKALQKIWDSMDNNFGQMVYDNLFWNRTIRDLAVASSLSLSWQLGTIREWGGAGLDIKEAIMKKKMPLWAGRIQFSITYPFVVGMIGGLMCYLFTGKPPQELLDYFYPKTGEKNPDGSDERLQLPAMTKEYWVAKAALEKHGIFKGISTVAWHKLNPVISLTLDLFTNQDYFKTEIRDPNAPLLKQAEQVAVFLGTSGLVPISIANFIRHEKISGEKSILPILGIGVAPRYITRTKIQNEIYNLYSKRFQGIKKRGEKYETNQIKAQLRSLLWVAENHHDPERRKKAWAEFVETLKEVKEKNIVLSKRFWKTIRLAPDIRVFSALNDEDQLDLLLKMTPKELTRYLRYAKRRAKYEFLKRKKTKEIQSFTRPKSTTGLLNYGL